jgi:hypothetical protein
MTSTASKSVSILVIWATTLVGGASAYAQSGPALSATDFTAHFEFWDGSRWGQMSAIQQQYFFNRARCECDQDPNAEFKIVIQPAAAAGVKIQTALENGLTGGQGVGRLFAGALGVDCLTGSNPVYGGSLVGYCTNLLDPGNYPGFSFGMAVFGTVNFWESPPIPVAYLFNSLTSPSCGSQGTCDRPALCRTTSVQTNIQFWAQTNPTLNPDFDPGPTAQVAVVGDVSLVPTNVTAEGGNEALNISWSWPSGYNPAVVPSFLGVQIFCQRGGDGQVFADGTFSPAYMTAAMLCPDTAPASLFDGAFSGLDKKFLCSGLLPPTLNGNPTPNSYRIGGLQDGISYGVGVAAIDKFGNISAISPADVVYGTPIGVAGGAGGTIGVGGGGGGSAGGPDADATGGVLGGGGAAGSSPADGAAGTADAGAGPRLASGCSCDIQGRHERSAGILWLAVVTLAFALRFRPRCRSNLRVGGRRPHPSI